MRKKQVWRYYCDHCPKSGCSAAHIKKHEAGCTRNPQRICGLCRKAGDVEQEPIGLLIDALTSGGIDALRTAANGCPACMLAAILQERAQRGVDLKQLGHEEAADEWNRHGEFDYTAEHRRWWQDYNQKADF